MRIGIVGSGKVGGTLTRRFREIGHDVAVANRRGPESLRPLADQTGATAGTVKEVAEKSDIVVLAIPTKAVPDLPPEPFAGKIVVDANNYYAERDGEIEPIDDRAVSSSRWTADHLPGARVIKAFNNISATRIGNGGKPARRARPDRAAGRRRRHRRQAGDRGARRRARLRPRRRRILDASWRQQPGTPVYLTDLDRAQLSRNLKA